MDKRLFDGRVLEKHSAYRSLPDMVVAAQGSDASRGLTLLEARSRRQVSGPNALPILWINLLTDAVPAV